MMTIMMIALMMMKNNCWQPWPVIRVGDGSLPGLVITGSHNDNDDDSLLMMLMRMIEKVNIIFLRFMYFRPISLRSRTWMD